MVGFSCWVGEKIIITMTRGNNVVLRVLVVPVLRRFLFLDHHGPYGGSRDMLRPAAAAAGNKVATPCTIITYMVSSFFSHPILLLPNIQKKPT